MITGDIKNQIDRIWDSFWSGGIAGTWMARYFWNTETRSIPPDSPRWWFRILLVLMSRMRRKIIN